MIGDCDVFIRSVLRGLGHLGNCTAAVAPGAMHLQITAQVLRPFRPIREQVPRFGERHEIATNRWNFFGEFRRSIKPTLNLSLYEGTNSAEFSRSEEHTSELQSLRHLVCR